MAIGTPHYMSPEQANGEAVDARSDLYALACVTYEMLAGSPPFTGRTAIVVMARHATDPVPSIATVRPEAALRFRGPLERALAKSPADRHATLEEWREDLKRPSESGDPGRVAPIRQPPPAPSTPLLGREANLQAAEAHLREGARLLTVTGYGGTGKTRFAVELFQRLQEDYPDGAAFVSLASVTAPQEVLPTIAVTLQITEAHGRSSLDALCTVIGERRVLLVLDNLEQVLDAAGDVASLLSRCPGLGVVATSRAPLKVSAEIEFALPPLDLPSKGAAAPDALLECPSVALFVQRAQKVQPSFRLTEVNAAAVSEICRRLDGLPLALELAAARVRILDPAALLQRLDHALDLLTSGDRDLPIRQRTLRTTISWSYSLLETGEQRLLRWLSVFHEGWTLEAAEEVCFTEEERYRGLDELDSLVEKGLVRVIGMGERYSLLDTIRAFAAEQLHAAGEVEAAREAHASHFVGFTADVAADIRGVGQLDAMQRARAENANTMAAVQWITARARAGDTTAVESGLSVCGNLCWPWHIHGQHLTGTNLVEVFLTLAADGPPSRGRALAGITSAMMRGSTGDWEGALRDADRAHADGLAIADDPIIAEAALHQGYIHLSEGRLEQAAEALQECIARAAASGAEFLHALGMSIQAMVLFLGGDLEAGIALVESALREDWLSAFWPR